MDVITEIDNITHVSATEDEDEAAAEAHRREMMPQILFNIPPDIAIGSERGLYLVGVMWHEVRTSNCYWIPPFC